MGFDKPANPNIKGTLEQAIGQIKAIPTKPSFMIHTGDITHLSKEQEFDDAEKIISRRGSTCITCRASTTSSIPRTSSTRERYGRGTKGSGYYRSTPTACTSWVWSMSPT